MPEITLQNVLIYLAVVNLLTFFAFWQDKRSSMRGGWRTTEASLLVMCLIGGSLGGYLAKKKFRHKTSKKSFKYRFWIIVFVQIAALIYLAYERYYFEIAWVYLSNFGFFS